jgi:hypothetical protein
MRRLVLLVAVLSLVGLALPARALDPIAPALPAGTPAPLVPLPFEGFMSENVEYLGTIPLDSPGVGARLRPHESGRNLLYVSGVPGLSIYDVTEPATPTLVSHLPLPNWENEDITISDDGRWALVSEFTAEIYLHVIDVSIPSQPRLVATQPLDGGAHTVDCIDAACNVVYGSEGQMIDLSDKTRPTVLEKNWMEIAEEQIRAKTGNKDFALSGGHALNVDEAGIVTTDTTPLVMLNVKNPLAPKVITTSDATQMDEAQTAYQHNNLRPRADEYRGRPTAKDKADRNLRPGELILGNGETNFTGNCGPGNGPFATYSARNFDGGSKIKLLDVLRPVSGDYSNGDPAVNAMGCSGHWFTTTPDGDDELVAAAWYDHGTRFLRVDGDTGKISQLGFFQPVVGAASAAHWIDDEHVYVVDYARGIDILRFDRSAPVPTTAEIDASWLAKLGQTSAIAAAERNYCALFGV